MTITGGGWGHGLGMSQYGAYGRALAGAGGEGILRHYYSHAHVKRRRMPARVRVGLLYGRTVAATTSTPLHSGAGKVVFKTAGSSHRIATGSSSDVFRVEAASSGGMRLYKNDSLVHRRGGTVFGSPGRPLVLKYAKFGTLARVLSKATNYAYGKMRFGTYRGCGDHCLRLVLALSMQRYLYGLGEVPASWPGGALRAQAMAGRTYAFEKIKRLGGHRLTCDCAVYDSTLDQAYIGDSKRTGSGPYWDDWKRAVDGTKRKVVLYNGKPIQALYSSSSGGHTEHNENVWGGTPIPYLRGVKDHPDAVSANPNHTWTETMSYDSFSSRLNASFNTGRVRDFDLVRPFGVSGRVTVVKPGVGGGVRIAGEDRTVRVSGYSIRSALGLRDTLFRVSIGPSRSRKLSHPAVKARTSGADALSRPDGLPEAAVREQRSALRR